MNPNSFLASLDDVELFLGDLKQILTSGHYKLDILLRKKDEDPLDPFTTKNTLSDLNYDEEEVKDELLSLTYKDYMETLIDDKDATKPPFWVITKVIRNRDVYIKVKIRNRLANMVFCISFHYARFSVNQKPYALFSI